MALTADVLYGAGLLVLLGMMAALLVDSRRRPPRPRLDPPSLAARITALEERQTTLDAHYADLKLLLDGICARQQEQATERQVYIMARRVARRMARDAARAGAAPSQSVTIAGGDALRAGNITGTGLGIGREAQGSNGAPP